MIISKMENHSEEASLCLMQYEINQVIGKYSKDANKELTKHLLYCEINHILCKYLNREKPKMIKPNGYKSSHSSELRWWA